VSNSTTILNNPITNNIYNQNNITTNTLTASKIIAPPSCGCWVINASSNDLKIDNMFPIICSLSSMIMSGTGKFDDFFVVAPYYKLELYFNVDYAIVGGARPWSGSLDSTSQIRTIDNTNGTTIRYVSSSSTYGAANQTGVASSTYSTYCSLALPVYYIP
jgi:hypothetical protein